MHGFVLIIHARHTAPRNSRKRSWRGLHDFSFQAKPGGSFRLIRAFFCAEVLCYAFYAVHLCTHEDFLYHKASCTYMQAMHTAALLQKAGAARALCKNELDFLK